MKDMMSTAAAPAAPGLDHAELGRAHGAIERAIDAASVEGLNVVGFGEVTLAIAWPTAAPTTVLKRLPVFQSDARFAAYAALIEENIAALAARGVPHVPTEMWSVPGAGGTVGYLVQPFLAPGSLLSDIVRSAPEEEVRTSFARVVEHIVAAVDADLGLDAQLPNWVARDGQIAMLDLSTPFMRDGRGRHRLDLPLLASIYPALVRRPLARWVFPRVLDQYHDRRAVLLDVAGNMRRQGLDDQLGLWLQEANLRLDAPIARAEVDKYFNSDTRTWAALQRMRRFDGWWQRAVRRRRYPFLLAPAYDNRADYGTAR